MELPPENESDVPRWNYSRGLEKSRLLRSAAPSQLGRDGY